jgi:hypothetical protein
VTTLITPPRRRGFEYLDPDGQRRGRREHVDDAAADGELAALLHQVDPAVRDLGEALDDPGEVGRGAGGQRHRGILLPRHYSR